MTALQYVLPESARGHTPGPVAGGEVVSAARGIGEEQWSPAVARPILVALDGSALAERALPYAAALAHERGAPLLLMRVVEVHGLATANLATAALTDLIADTEWAAAEAYLTARVQMLVETAPRLLVRSDLKLGDPALELLAVERASGVQLVVLTTHGRTGLARWLRGSVAEHVLRYGEAPVLLVRPWDTKPVETTRAGSRCVLVGLDGSALAEQVLAKACRLARPDGEVILAGVVQPPPDRHDPTWRAALERERTRVRTYLWRAAGLVQARGVPVRTVVLCAGGRNGADGVAGAIADLAVNDGADLIAMSTRGRGGLGRWLHGSVADQVAHVARVPVLLCRPPAMAHLAEPAAVEAIPAGAVR